VLIDMHCHVGVLDDPKYGRISDWMQRQSTFRIFLKYACVSENDVSNRTLHDAALSAIGEAGMDSVVCLALDAVYDDQSRRREDLSQFWVANEYVLQLQKDLGGSKILLGASIHPYRPTFEKDLRKAVDQGAVLLKWLPSAQHIETADTRVLDALRVTATAGHGGRPLPVLLHVGVEYAIITTDPKTTSRDFLSWSRIENARNQLRRNSNRWDRPHVSQRLQNLRSAVDEGAHIILAHAGLPYFAPNWAARYFEHSDFDVVRSLLESNKPGRGAFYADVSACCTPFRQRYFDKLRHLPEEYVLFGSDFPVPVFELSADLEENMRDLRAALEGNVDRLVIPQDNLLDVNYRELHREFPGHKMFSNFAGLLPT
jgi:hypothetical protein